MPGISRIGKKNSEEMALMWPLEAGAFVPLSSGMIRGLIASHCEFRLFADLRIAQGENLDVLNRRIIELEKWAKSCDH